ncbi:MAG: DUF4255 domain-containing protein [Methanosarcinales archaeon]|nr:DUF4255 domain-containing protein [Methanosarcinales archaeon]
MSDYTAIADVGETLVDLLRENMEDLIAPASIILFSPGEIEDNDDIRLSLFLFQVHENVHLKNQEMQVIKPNTTKYPPLNLDLYYLLTSYPSTGIQDKTERTKEEHSILGRAMQVIYDNAILQGSVLRGGLTENNEEIHITHFPLSLDDMTKIWTTFQDKPFRPSICYIATPTKIESTRERENQRVVQRNLNHHMMEVVR